MALSPRMPDLSAFEMLVAIARTGSLGAAGRELGLTQQAVSARLSAMEAQTGVRLVTRSARGSQLTSAGAVVTEWADQLLDVATHVDAGLASLRSASRKKMKVVASLTVAEQLMPRWIVSLQTSATRTGREAPEVILTATNSEQAIASVRDGSADLGFIESPGGADRYSKPGRRARRPRGDRAARPQVGASLQRRDRRRTQPDPVGRARAGFGHTRLADVGIACRLGSRGRAATSGVGTVFFGGRAWCRAGRGRAGGDEQVGGRR